MLALMAAISADEADHVVLRGKAGFGGGPGSACVAVDSSLFEFGGRNAGGGIEKFHSIAATFLGRRL